MSPAPIGPFTFWERFILGQELRGDEDTPDPPAGYTSWQQYYTQVVRGEMPLTTFTSPAGIPRGSKASMVWTRDGEDVATIGMHFLHRDGSDVTDFTNDDRGDIESYLHETLWDDIKPQFTGTIQLDRIVWHDYGVGIRKPNPMVREYVIAGGDAGTHVGTDPLPPQCATSVTFKTSSRRTWGRVYLPATVESNVTEGRFIAGYTVIVRDAFGSLLDFLIARDTPLVIWSPRHDGALLQTFRAGEGHPESAYSLGLDLPDSSSFARTVDQVQVDDLVDTIRSRRFAVPLVRSTHTP